MNVPQSLAQQSSRPDGQHYKVQEQGLLRLNRLEQPLAFVQKIQRFRTTRLPQRVAAPASYVDQEKHHIHENWEERRLIRIAHADKLPVMPRQERRPVPHLYDVGNVQGHEVANNQGRLQQQVKLLVLYSLVCLQTDAHSLHSICNLHDALNIVHRTQCG